MDHPNGRFVRHDLMTTDPDASVAFYSALFGWTSRAISIEGFPARVWLSGGERIGAQITLREPQIPPHWQAMVAVDDVHAVCARAESRGFTILERPLKIPGQGTFAVMADPRSGLIAAMQLEDPTSVPKRAMPPVGQFCWCQLITRDAEAALADYAAVFGWHSEAMPDQKDPVWVVGVGEGPQNAVGSIMQKPGEIQPGERDAWMGYVAVEDCAASAAKAVELGGEQRVAPTAIPGMGTFAVLSDPTGATFAVWENEG